MADESLAPLRFLFAYNEPTFWWWEVFDSLRRIALMGGA
jgi:hypothetical protein